MRRPVVLALVGLVVVVAAVVGFMVISGQRAAEALTAKYQAVAEALRAAGYEASIGAVTETETEGSVLLENVSVAAPGDATAWRWTAPRIVVDGFDGAAVTVRLAGQHSLSWKSGGTDHTAQLASDTFTVKIARDASGGVSSFEVEAGGLSLAEGEAAPITAKRLVANVARAAGAAGLIPDGSKVSLVAEEAVLPAMTRSALGDTIVALNAAWTQKGALSGLHLARDIAAWQAAGGALALDQIRLDWGLLDLTGKGSLGLDPDLRPAGELEVDLHDFLRSLDAFHVIRRYEDAQRSTWYAVLVEEFAETNAETSAFVMKLANGLIQLTRAGSELTDLTLGETQPVIAAAGG